MGMDLTVFVFENRTAESVEEIFRRARQPLGESVGEGAFDQLLNEPDAQQNFTWLQDC